MIGGGLLIAILTIENTLLIFAAFTAGSALVALKYLPDLQEQVKMPVLKIWGAVDKKIKTLGLSFGLLNGSLDAWGVVVLPVYLTHLGVTPTFIGTVMMAEYVFQGLIVTFFSKYVNLRWEPRKLLMLAGLLLVPVSLALSFAATLHLFLIVVFTYMFLFSGAMVYAHNHLMIEFASAEKTSLDLATYTTLSNIFKPIGVFVSGILGNRLDSAGPTIFPRSSCFFPL